MQGPIPFLISCLIFLPLLEPLLPVGEPVPLPPPLLLVPGARLLVLELLLPVFNPRTPKTASPQHTAGEHPETARSG